MIKVKVYFSDEQSEQLPENIRSVLGKCCLETLKYEHFPMNAEVNVTFVDNKSIHRLNMEYRNVDRPTDVLSFPLGENGEYDENPETGNLMLGDIVISVEKAKEQAKEYGHSELRELAFLTVHSMLHLLGYDHVNSEDEEKLMFGKQEKILCGLGISRD